MSIVGLVHAALTNITFKDMSTAKQESEDLEGDFEDTIKQELLRWEAAVFDRQDSLGYGFCRHFFISFPSDATREDRSLWSWCSNIVAPLESREFGSIQGEISF